MKITPQQQQAWDKVISLFEENLQKVRFDTWIRPLKLSRITQDSVVIVCENSMVLSHVQQRFYTDFYNYIKMCFGRAYELKFLTQDMETEEISHSSLNPKYTFDSFVVGPSNTFAYAAALAVAEQPSEAYNPLFIYGSVGLGKTHLMNAIGNFIVSEDPSKNVLLTSSESFTNELIDAIVKKKDTSELRNRMRGVDVLMVDDIQFLSKTKVTQEEFFHTFNELHNAHKQIIISSDRPPKDIPTIEERLRSRFEWGLIVDIAKPDYETRVAILRRKAQEMNISVPDDVIDFIAMHVESNIRELEGSLTRLNAQCQMLGMTVSLEAAKNSLSQLIKSQEIKRITPESIIALVGEQYGVTSEELLSKKRSREIAYPRQIAMYLCREMTQLSTTSIGKAFGNRNHTTILHGCEKIAADMKNDFAFSKRIDELIQMIKNS